MKKRSEKPRMVQQDLFASRPPPPPPTLPPDPVVEVVAAARRKRSETTVPFKTGPISDATGGPLSAEEAQRVLRGKTIRCAGWRFQSGVALCKGCFDRQTPEQVDALHAEHGYRAVLYGGAEYKGGLDCLICKRPIAP